MEIHLILCHSLMGPSPGSPPRSVSAQLNPSLFREGALDEDDDDDDTTALHSVSVASFLISARRRVILFFYPIPRCSRHESPLFIYNPWYLV